MSPIVVVAAVIERNGSFLLTLRGSGTHLEGHWEFPGGKCHPSETHAEALRRELHEELDIVAEVGERLHSVTHAYPEKTVALHFYKCDFQGEAKPMLGQAMRWVPRAELSTLPLPEADADLIRALASAGRTGPRRLAGKTGKHRLERSAYLALGEAAPTADPRERAIANHAFRRTEERGGNAAASSRESSSRASCALRTRPRAISREGLKSLGETHARLLAAQTPPFEQEQCGKVRVAGEGHRNGLQRSENSVPTGSGTLNGRAHAAVELGPRLEGASSSPTLPPKYASTAIPKCRRRARWPRLQSARNPAAQTAASPLGEGVCAMRAARLMDEMVTLTNFARQASW